MKPETRSPAHSPIDAGHERDLARPGGHVGGSVIGRLLLGLAWCAASSVALLPVLGRWLDPAVPTAQAHGTTDVLGVLVDLISVIGHRAWMLPALCALCAVTAVLSLGVWGWHAYRHEDSPQRRAAQWPLWALPLCVLLAALLDEYLPEFMT